MKNVLATLIIVLWMPTHALCQDNEIQAAVDTYLAPYIEMEDFAGVVLVAKSGELLVLKGYGLANYDFQVHNTLDTRFHVASLSKIFTAATIILLEKEERLNLDDSLDSFIPGFPEGEAITIAHLLTHQSGLQDFYAWPEYDSLKTQPLDEHDWIDLLKEKSLAFPPGSQNSYSNSGYAVLARIIEIVSEKSYGDVLAEKIFSPLGLENSGIWNRDQIIPNRAAGYDPWLGTPGVRPTPYYQTSVLFGSGSLYTTAGDLYQFFKAIREKALFDGDTLDYPYGWGVRERFGRPLLEQDGNVPGFAAHISAYLEDDLCIIVLSNIRSGALGVIKEDLAAIALGEEYAIPTLRTQTEPNVTVFPDYTGRYAISPQMEMTVKTDGQYLFLKGTGGYFLPLEPIGEDTFFFPQLYVPIVFDRDADRRVNQLLWAGEYPIARVEGN